MMSKPKSSINLGTIKEETCLPALRHPAYRWHELITGVCTESRIKFGTGSENLSSRYEGKTSSNGDCKRESTDAWHGGGTSRSSEEVSVMGVARRGCIVRLFETPYRKTGRNLRTYRLMTQSGTTKE